MDKLDRDKRDQAIRHDAEILGLSDTELARRYGLSAVQVRRIRGRRRRREAHQVLSPVHRSFGRALSFGRHTHELEFIDLSKVVDIPVVRLKGMELGYIEFTLTDLIKLNPYMGVIKEEHIATGPNSSDVLEASKNLPGS